MEGKAKHRDRAKEVVLSIGQAFEGVTLEDGIGLWQAQRIDDYASEREEASARESDEKEDWSHISFDDLNACSSSLCFFDAKGMRFHLPAYLIADLNEKYLHGMAFCLVDVGERAAEQFALLSPLQRAAIREFLKYIAVDDRYEFEKPNILRALEEYWSE